MNVNKKFDRFKQWAGERMGGEVKTNVSEDFKLLEEEMTCRHEGTERLQKSMTSYIKSISKTKEAEERDRSLPVSYMGSVMIGHGEQFGRDSVYGNCLVAMGRTNERIGRTQENYIGKATSSWLESLERSLAQMKEYQTARKKLEARRLAYDASLSKMQKAKREDFRVEEELRSQKAKYEESNEDVFRRMQDIKEAESESVADLGAFLEAELEYHHRCHEILLRLKSDWPAAQDHTADVQAPGDDSSHPPARRPIEPAYHHATSQPGSGPRPSIRSSRTAPVFPKASHYESSQPQPSGSARMLRGPSAIDPPSAMSRDVSPMRPARTARMASDPVSVGHRHPPSHQINRINTNSEHFADLSDDSAFSNSSPERSCDELPESPTTSYGSVSSRVASSTTLHTGITASKKMAPPPPPSRSKKPPPPPPPMKRSTLSTTSVPYA